MNECSGLARVVGAQMQSVGSGPLKPLSIKNIDSSGWQGPL